MKNIKNTKGVGKFRSEDLKQSQDEIARLEGKIQELALIIDKVEDEKLEVINQLKRALADYQNLESNTQKRLNIMYLQARKSLAEQLIPIVDDMGMAVKAKEEVEFNESSQSWANGVIELLRNLERSLAEIGLKKYVPEKGSKFDPSLHEALTVVEGKIPGVIHDVIQPGYLLDDVVIRPSRVVVTKKN
ncbi:MAG: nucleotide exchange factor GrpE [Candidatus Dojkabacteria bacterium]|jgi:molecular chaperone GrpE|nr:nucleotide exchange factor GrpE [Candidatus Dojkabacteria bacterium]